ncbi:MAG: ATP-binding protein, partial [Burkholderiaceae bacterium]
MAEGSRSIAALAAFFAKADTAIVLLREMHARRSFHGCINATTLGFSRTGLADKASSLEDTLPEQQDLAYISPEQTGRMNHVVDYRSDYYSLGIVFYELLTGRLPFISEDMMEVVHSHIARQPASPHQLNPEVPKPVSDIVIKLLSKNAGDRYQSLHGLEADLAYCKQMFYAGRPLNRFVLGKKDVFDRLPLTEKLYGRELELKCLMDAFTRTADGGAEILLVSGYSGIGKSSLINSIQQVVREKCGIFLSGKFDQFKRNIPYAMLAHAFQGFILQIMGESEAELARWRAAVHKAVGSNGQLLIGLIPALELVIGKQSAAVELASTEAQNRLQLVFDQFVRVFAQPEHPLVLFLDDLQWVDAASLKLLEHLLSQTDMKHLLLIGAYRDNEVDPAHPLMLSIASLRKRTGVVHEIQLAPLMLADMNSMIADSLLCSPERSKPLAELVFQKTAGNPFFTRQFLNTLYEEKLLVFDAQQAQDLAWQWDIEQIQAKDITDNVVELMVEKLQRLSMSSLDVLKCLACLGNSASISMLATVAGLTEKEAEANLDEALRSGFLLRISKTLKFAHDRIQEAAYSLIPNEQKAALHLSAGRLLVAQLDSAAMEGLVFDVVHQFNRGIELVNDAEERDRICRLNRVAGKKAKDSAAYASARDYLAQAIALLPGDCWSQRFDDTFALYLDCAECELVLSHFQETDALLDICQAHMHRLRDRARIYFLRNRMYYITKRVSQGLDAGLETLELFGVAFPKTDQELLAAGEATRQKLSNALALNYRSIAELIDLPVVTDPD